jgi:hypothetical protein
MAPNIIAVHEGKVPRKIIGPKREKVADGWRTLYNEELHTFYFSPNTIREIKNQEYGMGWACSKHGKMRRIYLQNFSLET